MVNEIDLEIRLQKWMEFGITGRERLIQTRLIRSST